MTTSSAEDNANPEVNENYTARIMNTGVCVMWQIHTVYSCTKRLRLLSVILEGKICQYWHMKGGKKKSHSLFVVTERNILLNNDFYLSRTTSETYMKRSLEDS